MDIDPKFAADLKNALDLQGVELPWADLELAKTFWRAVEGLGVDQAVKVARAVHAGVENGRIEAQQR
ncbi:hypothetical protein AB0H73_36675 [Streptomyces olivoreticuli]